jgi:NADPH:quinone reductase-like Zn-dependent oxidoreductase
MKAWRIERHGGPDVLQYVELPEVQPGPMEVRVRVQAVGLNHLDLWTRNGVPGHRFPLPITPGCDIVGIIDEFGEGSAKSLEKDGLRKGSAVVLNPGVSCGRCEWCLGGFDPLCPRYGILGETQDGGCAEYIHVPVANLIALPAGLSPVDAAALPIPYLTAWTMLMRKAELRPGQLVLIQAGGSGVSVAAIQFAKMFGANVITTVGSDFKVEKARALGADHVIQYRKTPFRDEVKKILASYGKKGCDIVIDHVGADTFADSLKCLSWGGKLVTCGATSGSNIAVDLKAVFFKNISILGSTMGSKADLIRIVGLAGSGKIKPVVDSVFKMDQLKEAMARLEQRSIFGKVILTV